MVFNQILHTKRRIWPPILKANYINLSIFSYFIRSLARSFISYKCMNYMDLIYQSYIISLIADQE